MLLLRCKIAKGKAQICDKLSMAATKVRSEAEAQAHALSLRGA
jgi:hypothetical protein